MQGLMEEKEEEEKEEEVEEEDKDEDDLVRIATEATTFHQTLLHMWRKILLVRL